VRLTKKDLFYTAALLAVIGKGIVNTAQIKKMKRHLETVTGEIEEKIEKEKKENKLFREQIEGNRITEQVENAVREKHVSGRLNNLESKANGLEVNIEELQRRTWRLETIQEGDKMKKEAKADEDLKSKWTNMPPQEAKSKIKRLIYQLGENPANAFSDEKIVEIMSTRHGVEPWVTEYLLKERDRAEKYYETLSLKLDWDNLSENDKERLAEIISYVSIDHDGFMSTEHIKRDFKKRFNGKPSVILEAKALADKKRDELYEKGELVFPPKRG
jgi:hypothetical protein